MTQPKDKSAAIDVNFSCQRCCQPLRLHSTLNNSNKETFQDLTTQPSRTLPGDKANPDDHSGCTLHVQTKDSNHVIQKTINSFRDYTLINVDNNVQLQSSSITSSLLSGFDQSSSKNKSSKDLKLQIKLFDILSDQSDIDHPLCEECADFVIEQMDKQLIILEQECKEFTEYRNKIEETQSTVADDEVESLNSKLKELSQTQKSLIAGLKSLNEQQRELDQALVNSEKELIISRLEEEKYWHEYNTVKFQHHQCEEELRTLENKIRYAKEYYNKLKRTSIFNTAFCIWYTGPFGTINGFRLGRLPDVQVEWHEINAAWGQCALLLTSLAKKLGFQFREYKIVPYGNFSFIESLDDKSKQLPLYTSGGLKYYFHQKFDLAMVAYFDCLQQFYEEIKRQDKGFKLPYEMDPKGDIFDMTNNQRYSIKINISTEEKWTKALKFMLTNLKWALAWVAKNGE